MGLTLILLGAVWFLWLAIRLGKLFHIAGAMMILIGLGFVVIGTFNTDTTVISTTLHGTIHLITTVSILLLFPLFCVILSFSLRRHLHRRWLALYTIITGIIGLAFLASFIIPPLDVMPSGLGERLSVSVDLLWLAIAGSQVTFLARKEEKKLERLEVKTKKQLNESNADRS